MVVQEDTIFVSGMDPTVTEDEICEHFGAIGIIKVYRNVMIEALNNNSYGEPIFVSVERQANWKAKDLDVQGQEYRQAQRRSYSDL